MEYTNQAYHLHIIIIHDTVTTPGPITSSSMTMDALRLNKDGVAYCQPRLHSADKPLGRARQDSVTTAYLEL